MGLKPRKIVHNSTLEGAEGLRLDTFAVGVLDGDRLKRYLALVEPLNPSYTVQNNIRRIELLKSMGVDPLGEKNDS